MNCHRRSALGRSTPLGFEALESKQLLASLGSTETIGIALDATMPDTAPAAQTSPIEVSATTPNPSFLVMSIVSGDGQSAPAGSAFSDRLAVRVTDPSGVPVTSGFVQFEAPVAGATAVIPAMAALDSNGVASISALAGPQRGSYDVIATFNNANPVQFTLTNRLNPLTVVNVSRFGFHARPTRIALTFNLPLDPQQASRVGNYRLLGPGLDRTPGVAPDRPLAIRSVRFDSATNTVAIAPAQPLRLLGGRRYLVAVSGEVVPGGTPGVATTAFVGAEDLVATPDLTRGLNRARLLNREFRGGTGRLI